jgi:cellulose synthase/poly-beta-1,6-N-acetylglucosamine synthase-like glycosyltransferase
VAVEIAKPAPIARFIVPAALAVGATYLTWRAGWTGAGSPPWLFWPLWLAELTILVELIRMTFEFWTLRSNGLNHQPGYRPSVDVVVVCRDEPAEVLRATLLGCAAIRGEHRTVALDTIGRAELAEIASGAGASHLISSAPLACAAEEHLNAALAYLDGEFVTVLHGDDVPLPNLIEELIGDFADEATWMAQGRQALYGTSNDEYHRAPGQLEMFYSVVQPGKANHEASYWCGSGAILRRSAIDSLGAIPPASETPTFQMSLRASRHGLCSTYHDEPVVLRLACPEIRGFVEGHTRWATGNLRALRSADSPLWARGYSFAQRMSYLGTASTYVGGLRRAVFIAVLTATLLTGRLPLTADPVLVASAWGIWMGFGVLARRVLTRTQHGEPEQLREQWMLMGAHCSSWIAALRDPRPDRVTESSHSPLRLFTLGVALIALGLAVQLVGVTGGPMSHGPGGSELWLVLAGSLSVLCIYASVLVDTHRRWRRSEPRFAVRASADLSGIRVPLLDVSEHGASVALADAPPPGFSYMVGLLVPGLDGEMHRATVAASVSSVRPDPVAEPGSIVGLSFTHLSAAARERLAEYCRVLLPARVAALRQRRAAGHPDYRTGLVPGGSMTPTLASAFQAEAVSADSSGSSPRPNQRVSRISAERGSARSADAS